jgi:hypothetical protein
MMAKPSNFILIEEEENQVKKHLVKKCLGINPLGRARIDGRIYMYETVY